MKLKSDIRDRARELRHNATPAERKLWRALRTLNRQGFHFRRQVPFRGWFLDFAEHGKKLVIEIDGDTHGSTQDQRRDQLRDRVLAIEGYCVLRFWNSEIHASVDGAIARILETARRPPP